MSTQPLDSGHPSSTYTRQAPFLWVSAGLGIASAFIGVALFLVACAGFDGAFYLGYIPAALGGVSLVLFIIALTMFQDAIEAPQAVAGMFISLMGMCGGLLELAVINNWVIFVGK